MPADENVASLPPRMILPSQNTPESSYSQVTEKYGLQLPNGLQKQPFADSYLNHPTRPTEKTAVFQPSSGPVESCPLTDEYVIITKSDPRDRSEPQNIPRMGLVSQPVNRGMEEYEMMHPAQLASIRGRRSPSPNPGTKVGANLAHTKLFPSHQCTCTKKGSTCNINLRYRAMKTMIFPGSGPTLPTVA